MVKEAQTRLGAKIKQKRSERKLSIRELSAKIKAIDPAASCSPSQLSKIENGLQLPNLELVEILSQVLGVELRADYQLTKISNELANTGTTEKVVIWSAIAQGAAEQRRTSKKQAIQDSTD